MAFYCRTTKEKEGNFKKGSGTLHNQT